MRTVFVLLLAIVAVALSPVSVWAEVPTSNTSNVGPIGTGPTVSTGSAGFNGSGTNSQANSQTNEGAPPTPVPQPGGSGSSNLTYTPIQNGVAPGGGSVVALVACPPGSTPYAVFDATGAFVGTVCVSNQAPAAGPLSTPVQLAQQASAQQPWPALQVGINPGIGLTGLASWYWLAGNPQMPDATATAAPLTVTVHATLIDVVWDFGDGSGLSSGTDLGRAFPAQSSIQHVFESDTFGRPGYKCTALVRYRVTYSVNSGPFAELGVKANPYSVTYQVNQLQPEAVSLP
jgi:hypothetical protein